VPTETLSAGRSYAITQNVVYALPPKIVRIHSLAAVEISVDGVAWDALVGADTVGAEAASTYLRCPGGDTTVSVRSF
jgi:hypothetical protein